MRAVHILDALTREREAQGEDEESGTVPVEFAWVDTHLDLDGTDVEEALLDALGGGDKSRRVGRLPSEVLFWMMSLRYGRSWATQVEVEVIVEDLLISGGLVDGAGFSKISALKSIMSAPSAMCPFHNHWKSFFFLACSLVGRPTRWDELAYPTALEAAVAINIVEALKPGAYSDEVQVAIAAACIIEGIWVLPGVLSMCQDEVLRILEYEGVDITHADVDSVARRVAQAQSEGRTSDQIPVNEDGDEMIHDMQVVKVLGLQERVNDALRLGEEGLDALWSAHEGAFHDRIITTEGD